MDDFEQNKIQAEDLFLMLNVSKQLGAEINVVSQSINKTKSTVPSTTQKHEDKNDESSQEILFLGNKNDKNVNKKIVLEKQIKDLKTCLINFESIYNFISPYHEDIQEKLKEKQKIQKIPEEITKKIKELYDNKYYLDCYNLWKIYAFQKLPNVPGKDNFEMFRHLTKIKDIFNYRDLILENLDKINIFSDLNYHFNNDFPLKTKRYENSNYTIDSYSIDDKKKRTEEGKSGHSNFYNNNSNLSESIFTNKEIYKQKQSENDLLLKCLKGKMINLKQYKKEI